MRTYYEVSGFKFDERFETEAEALKRFEEVKTRFTYCEAKKVEENGPIYYAKSIKVYAK